MKKKTAFKLRSGNKPDAGELTGASPMKYEYFYQDKNYQAYDPMRDNPYRGTGSLAGSQWSFSRGMSYDRSMRQADIALRAKGARQQMKELNEQRKNVRDKFDT